MIATVRRHAYSIIARTSSCGWTTTQFLFCSFVCVSVSRVGRFKSCWSSHHCGCFEVDLHKEEHTLWRHVLPERSPVIESNCENLLGDESPFVSESRSTFECCLPCRNESKVGSSVELWRTGESCWWPPWGILHLGFSHFGVQNQPEEESWGRTR
jgi:hypothetical protein